MCTGLGYLNIFPLAYRAEGCVQHPLASKKDRGEDEDQVGASVQLQNPSTRFIVEMPLQIRKFVSINGLLLASLVINQPAVLSNCKFYSPVCLCLLIL